MTLGQFLAALTIAAALKHAGQSRRWLMLLSIVLGLRLISRFASVTAPWLERYAAIAFSPSGSLLLWATLACLIAASPLIPTQQEPRQRQLYERITLTLITLLLVIEVFSRGSGPTGAFGVAIGSLMVIHTLAIFTSYGCQLALLSLALAALSQRESMDLQQMATQPLTGALLLQLLGTISGSLWAATAWGSPWGWDPIECLSLSALIWLTVLRLRRPSVMRWWYGLGLVAVPTYTILGAVLVRSGLLARASRHGYLSGSNWPMIIISLACMAVLIWTAHTSMKTLGGPPRSVWLGMLWGLSHWLAGLIIVIIPAIKPLIAALLTISWLSACGWFFVMGLPHARVTLHPNKKP
ncbi:MAG: cytochrome c biogenesis protein CcsA [Bacillota bacterium]